MGTGRCLPCAAGTYAATTGLTSCSACSSLTNSAAGATACISVSSSTSSVARRALSLTDGVFNASDSNSSAIVVGSALRAQLAGILGVSVSYILVAAADTACAGQQGPPVHDTFGSGDAMNSDVLFGGAPKTNPPDYTYVAPQGPDQTGDCSVVWTVMLQVPVGMPPPAYGAARSAPFSADAVAALAAYMRADPATATGTVAVDVGAAAPLAPTPTPAPTAPPATAVAVTAILSATMPTGYLVDIICADATVVAAAAASFLGVAQTADAAAFVINATCTATAAARRLAGRGRNLAATSATSVLSFLVTIGLSNAAAAAAYATSVANKATADIAAPVVAAAAAASTALINATGIVTLPPVCATAAFAFPACTAAAAAPSSAALSGGAIAGIAVGSVAFVALVAAIAAVLIRRRAGAAAAAAAPTAPTADADKAAVAGATDDAAIVKPRRAPPPPPGLPAGFGASPALVGTLSPSAAKQVASVASAAL